MDHQEAIEIRMLGSLDGAALTRLAQRDTAATPPHPVLGGIVGGRLVAAHSLATGESVADPFTHTAEIRSLLAQRAVQLRGDGGKGALRLLPQLGGELAGRPGAAPGVLR